LGEENTREMDVFSEFCSLETKWEIFWLEKLLTPGPLRPSQKFSGRGLCQSASSGNWPLEAALTDLLCPRFWAQVLTWLLDSPHARNY